MAKKTMSERKHTAILEAAMFEFKSKGYHAASMDSISRLAKVSKRTVYNHFSSKEMLFMEFAKELMHLFQEVTSIEYEKDRSLEAQLLAFAKVELELFASARFCDLSRVVVSESIHSPELVMRAMEQIGVQEKSFEKWIEAAIADRRLRSVDIPYAAEQFIGLIKASAFWPQLIYGTDVPDKKRSQSIAKDTVKMFLALYEIG